MENFIMSIEERLEGLYYTFFKLENKETYSYTIIGIPKNSKDKKIKIEYLVVNPHFRNKGIGTKCLEYTINYIQENFPDYKIFLWSKPLEGSITDEDLVKWYEKRGFEIVKKHEESGEYLMEYKELDDELSKIGIIKTKTNGEYTPYQSFPPVLKMKKGSYIIPNLGYQFEKRLYELIKEFDGIPKEKQPDWVPCL